MTDETPEQAQETHETPETPGRKKVPGSGLVQGLATTFKNMTTRAHTHQYPDVAPELPPRTRGVIALIEENCTSCMLCARECPDWCIYIDSHKETIPAPTAGGRERSRNVLDRFAIDYSLCMYCGICIEVCPFDALEWSPEFEYAEYDIKDMLHEKDRMTQWVETIPPPVALDDAAEEPKEIALAQKAVAKKQAALDAAAQAPTLPPSETSASNPSDPPASPPSETPAPNPSDPPAPNQEAEGDA